MFFKDQVISNLERVIQQSENCTGQFNIKVTETNIKASFIKNGAENVSWVKKVNSYQNKAVVCEVKRYPHHFRSLSKMLKHKQSNMKKK